MFSSDGAVTVDEEAMTKAKGDRANTEAEISKFLTSLRDMGSKRMRPLLVRTVLQLKSLPS